MPPRQKKTKRTPREPTVAGVRTSSAALFQLDELPNAKIARTAIPAPFQDSDDDQGAVAPRYDLCLRAEGSNGILRYTNFTPREFDSLWDAMESFVTQIWNVALWEVGHGCPDLSHSTAYISKDGAGFLAAVGPYLYEEYVDSLNDSMAISKMALSGKSFKHFPGARYATGVTFQQANRPAGTHSEAITYYSGKHHLYGYKVEVSVLPTGLALNCSPRAKGSVSDITIFRENDAFHLNALKKRPDEMHLEDDGPFTVEYPRDWAVLTDKDYQVLRSHFRAIHPKRQTRLNPLPLEETRNNDRISHDRVIVENYFGRMKTLWGVCSDKWRWDEGAYDLFFRVCLTLSHVRLCPLRDEEGDDYQRYDARLRGIGFSIKACEKEKHTNYQEGRAARLVARSRMRGDESNEV
ncbi:hypothetical protein PF010_g2742 [Phytophthora fragariae]|uniref:DDE Tnp4 domain-containing protein n=1 Tax=Phytophthora fragariae TaxID=53985 RepID=A0A6G0LX59_9STRA|nr:hypothetical protein PF010_g2742 [Phytophthora fragariae]